MKNSLLLAGVAILLLGLTQKFDGQEKTQSHRHLPLGGKAVIEQQRRMAQPPIFSRQESNRWLSDQMMPYQHRMTNRMGYQDLRVNTAITGGTFAQHELSSGVDTAWVRHYASGLAPTGDAATAIAIDGSGNIYVAGNSSIPYAGDDYMTVKYDSSGSQIWKACYNGPENSDDHAHSLAVDASGNIYVTGTSIGSGTGEDYATVKYNSEGIQQWVARYNGVRNGADRVTALAVDDSGNVYVTGETEGSAVRDTLSYTDFATVKYNSAGVQQWVACYNEGLWNRAAALTVDDFGNVYVTGTSVGSSTGTDYATIKYNSKGIKQWAARYNKGPNEGAHALAVDGFGNVYVTGYSEDDYATIKYNSDGAEQWVARYNGPGDRADFPCALAVDGFGNVYVTGRCARSGTWPYDYDYATVKYNSDGIQQWVARYNETPDDWAAALAVDGFGNVYVTGFSGTDYATIKYNSEGVRQWIARYNGPGNSGDTATALALDASGNVYVTGGSDGLGKEGDFATVKYNSEGIQQWVARCNRGFADDYAVDLAIDVSNNIYVTGTSVGLGTGEDYVTVKYNSAGVEQRMARYNGPENSDDWASALIVDASENVYVTGGSGDDYATIKYNSEGVEQWVARYNGSGYSGDGARTLAVDDWGNVYVTGFTNYNYDYWEPIHSDYATIKYNSSGVEQWVACYNGPGNDWDEATDLAIDSFGNVYVTGMSKSSDGWQYIDYATIKYNSEGIEQWVARYNGPGNKWDEATDLAIDSFGNVYVTGYGGDSGTGCDYATIKYNSEGIEQWVARYNGPGDADDFASAMVVDAYGNVYVSGHSQGSSTEFDYATIKYNSEGIEQWVARYNGPGNTEDRVRAMAMDESGNIYVTGRSQGSGTEFDYATVKYNSDGVKQWVARYDGPRKSNDEANSLIVDAAGNVYVTGSSAGDGWRIYTTIKYVQTPVSVDKQENGKPSRYWLAQNYPNPFNPSTTVEFALPKSAFVTLKVYNLLGEEVATLIAEQRTAGIHKLNWDARGLASEVYLYRLEAGDFVAVRKLVLMH